MYDSIPFAPLHVASSPRLSLVLDYGSDTPDLIDRLRPGDRRGIELRAMFLGLVAGPFECLLLRIFQLLDDALCAGAQTSTTVASTSTLWPTKASGSARMSETGVVSLRVSSSPYWVPAASTVAHATARGGGQCPSFKQR